MRNQLIIFLLLILLSSTALFADSYAVVKPDGSVVIAHYFESSKKPLEKFLSDVGLSGLPIKKIDEKDIPQDGHGKKVDRDYWQALGKKIVIDEEKKTEVLSDALQKESEKQAVLAKLKLTEEEAELLKSDAK